MSGLVTQGLGESTGGGGGFQISTVTAAANQITLVFTLPVTDLTGPSLNPANWIMTVSDGISQPVTITGVSISSGHVILVTTDQTGGGLYILTIPLGIMSSGTAMLGPFIENVTGVQTVPALMFARSIDEYLVDVVFSSPPLLSHALDPSKYSTSPPLTIISVTELTVKNFRIQTSAQAIGQSYILSWAG